MQQLSALDATFLDIETPTHPQQVVAVLGLAGPRLNLDQARAAIADRLPLIPSFRRRLVQTPWHLDLPYWVQDQQVDVSQHVQHVVCPSPAGFGPLVGRIAAGTLDRRRPLWEAHLIDGVDGSDGQGLVVKVHHSTMYGVAGVAMLATLLDLEPSPPPDTGDRAGDQLESPPNAAALLSHAGAHALRRPLTGARLLGGVARAVRSEGTGGAVPFRAPRTALNGTLTSRRAATLSSVPLADVLSIRRHFGVSVNDVVLAAVSSSLRRYLSSHGGVPHRPLHAGVPVYTGSGAVSGADRLSARLVPLVLDTEDPVELLERTAANTAAGKRLSDALGGEIVEQAAGVLPPLALRTAARLYDRLHGSALHPPLQSLIVSNVRGADVPLYFAGARVVSIHPFGPLLFGSGVNVSVMSHVDRLDVGVLSCPDVVADAIQLADGFGEAVEKLAAAT